MVAVTSKVVSKAEGRVRAGDRDTALPEETVRVVARRGGDRHRAQPPRPDHGRGGHRRVERASRATSCSCPSTPTRPPGALRAALRERTGANVAVVVTDTSGRAWREGQTDIAVGAAGLVVLDDHRGRVDPHGNALAVTAPAVADEVAGAAELAQGKLAGRPFAVLRGLQRFVLPAGDDGPGAGALVRPEAERPLRVRRPRGRRPGGARRPGVAAPASVRRRPPRSWPGTSARRSGAACRARQLGPGEITVHDDDPRVAVAGPRLRLGAASPHGSRRRSSVATSRSVDYAVVPARPGSPASPSLTPRTPRRGQELQDREDRAPSQGRQDAGPAEVGRALPRLQDRRRLRGRRAADHRRRGVPAHQGLVGPALASTTST